ncbi:MAG TPA: glycosyltransferase [Candidatus Baltobacteraceae bacterium]
MIAAYQSAAFIEATLATVHAQTLRPHEIIVVDDGSTDQTEAVARACGATVIRQTNGGPSAARNTGVRAAASPWIAFLDADDLWEPFALERLAAAAQVSGNVDLVFSDSQTFDEQGTLPATDFARYPEYRAVARSTIAPGIVLCERESLVEGFTRAMFILTSTVLARREALLACGLFDPTLRIAEDWDLFLRMLRRSSAAVVEEPLVRYRLHGTNISRDGAVNGMYYRLLVERVEAHPDRYPEGSVALFRRELPRWTFRNGVDALREGRFADGAAAFEESRVVQRSSRTTAALLVAQALNNAAGRTLYRAVRSGWSKRPWKYRKNP